MSINNLQKPESLGKVVSIFLDGSVGVVFPTVLSAYEKHIFEVYKDSGSPKAVGVGKLRIQGPGQYILVPIQSALKNPEIGDTVRICSEPIQPKEHLSLSERMANLLRPSGV